MFKVKSDHNKESIVIKRKIYIQSEERVNKKDHQVYAIDYTQLWAKSKSVQPAKTQKGLGENFSLVLMRDTNASNSRSHTHFTSKNLGAPQVFVDLFFFPKQWMSTSFQV